MIRREFLATLGLGAVAALQSEKALAMSTTQSQELARAYSRGDIVGWAEVLHPGLAKQQFEILTKTGLIKPQFFLSKQTRHTAGRKMFLHEVVRKVLGKDTANYAQEIGDCVSFGAKNATEYLQCCEKLIHGERVKWRPVFPPYYYGSGRVYIGRGRLGHQDGSLGSWMAEAVMRYGTLWADEEGVPQYSGNIAKRWGDPNGRDDIDIWKSKAESFKVKSAALIKNWDDLVAAIVNGYPCTTASDIGYDMEPSSDGFHRQRGNWPHQMCIIGVDETYPEHYGLILNSWADAHGRLKDFQTGDDLPIGVLRVKRRDIEKHIRANETFAYSDLDHFPERDIDKALFDLI